MLDDDYLDSEDACELEGGEPEVLDEDFDEDLLEAKIGQMREASEQDFSTWAEHYDDLNGAPEDEEDR